MSYKLADGSMSTDYKIGDEFAFEDRTFILSDDDGSVMPWFREVIQESDHPLEWPLLTPVKEKNHASVINQLHEKIRQLKATIKELER
jgi:hypothetical protein